MSGKSQFHGNDASLIAAWLTARSVARDLPLPVPDRGGFRVDTNSETELRRWVFPRIVGGMSELAHEISTPRHFIKLCGSEEELSAAVPAPWQLQPVRYVMVAGSTAPNSRALPDGYRIHTEQGGPRTHVRIEAPDGTLAASGYAAETADVFIYDRIETKPAHRRLGLGRAIMVSLGAARTSQSVPQVLVATEDGRQLYTSLGWSLYSPYATVTIPQSS